MRGWTAHNVGGFSVRFSLDYRLDVFPDSSLDSSEQWRIFQPKVDSRHFVFPSDEAVS
jgi:hypothetical protein